MPSFHITRGILLMLISTIFFALMNAFVKYLSDLGYSSMENMFFRAFFMMVFMGISLSLIPTLNQIFPKLNLKKPKMRSKKKGGFAQIFLRSFFGAIAMSLTFYNFATIPLGISTAFLQSMPIFMVIFSLFTREKPTLFAILATVIGFFGVLLIANPNTSHIPIENAIAGIVGAISACLSFMSLRALRKYYESGVIVLWYGISMSIVGALGMLLPIPKMGGFIMPDLYALSIFILSGLTGTIGQWFMTKSYMFASPGVVTPVSYMRIVWSLFLGFFLGDAFPNSEVISGISLIILSGVLIALPVFVEEYKRLQAFKRQHDSKT